jgi:hypothetical protein
LRKKAAEPILMSDSEPPADQPRVLAEFSDYRGLMTALRQRAQEKHAAINGHAAAAGLERCIAKLVAPVASRRINIARLGELLTLLNCKLVMVHDEEAVRKYGHRMHERNEAFVHSGVITLTKTRQMFAEMGIKGNFLRWSRVRAMRAAASKAARIRWDNTTPKQRSAYARKAARARWANGNGKGNGNGNGNGHE